MKNAWNAAAVAVAALSMGLSGCGDSSNQAPKGPKSERVPDAVPAPSDSANDKSAG